MKDLPDNFCTLPWTAISARPIGQLNPCCEFANHIESYSGTNPRAYLESKELKYMKESFLNGTWPKGCFICKSKEDSNNVSKRMNENEYYKNNVGPITRENIVKHDKFLLTNLQLSNLCNLGCVMCGPGSSSFIQEEVMNNTRDALLEHWEREFSGKYLRDDVDFDESKVQRPGKSKYTQQDIVDFVDLLDTEKGQCRLYLTGGEPSLIKEVYTILELVTKRGLTEKVFVEFNSNFQALNPKYLDYIKNFRGMVLASVDGIDKVAHYHRYPSNWKTVRENLLRFRDLCPAFQVFVYPTFSIMNVFHVNELLNWANENEFDVDLYNIVTHPSYFNIQRFDKYIRNKALEEIKTFRNYKFLMKNERYRDTLTNLINHVSAPKPKVGSLPLFEESPVVRVAQELDRVDKLRGLKWKKTFPKFYKIIRNQLKSSRA